MKLPFSVYIGPWIFSKSVKAFILTLIVVCPVKGLYCQETNPSKSSSQLGINLGNNQIKENILLPKVHKGSFTELSYTYEYEKRNLHEFVFKVGVGLLKTKLETEKVTWNGQIDAGYSWGKKLVSAGKIKYFLGLNLNYLLSIMEYPVWDESRAYWATAISAGPYNRMTILFDNHSSLVSTLRIDLAGLTSRPDKIRLYAQEEWTLTNIMKITNSHFSFCTPDSFIIFFIRNEYRIPLKNNNFISFCNSVTYTGVSENNELPLQNLRIFFGAGIGF